MAASNIPEYYRGMRDDMVAAVDYGKARLASTDHAGLGHVLGKTGRLILFPSRSERGMWCALFLFGPPPMYVRTSRACVDAEGGTMTVRSHHEYVFELLEEGGDLEDAWTS